MQFANYQSKLSDQQITNLPAWFGANRPTHDVAIDTPALPTMATAVSAIVGQRLHIPILDEYRVFLNMQEFERWMGVIREQTIGLSPLCVAPLCNTALATFESSVAAFDGKSACKAFFSILEGQLTHFSKALMESARECVSQLPHGDVIWQELAGYSLFALCLSDYVEQGDPYRLSYESTDFFVHYEAMVDLVPVEYRAAYVSLIDHLIVQGDGAWQSMVYEIYEGVEAIDDDEGFDEVEAFVGALAQATSESVLEVIAQYDESDAVQCFMEQVNEYLFYGDLFPDAIEGDFEGAIDTVKGAFERVQVLRELDKLIHTEKLALSSIQQLNGDSPWAALLRTCAQLAPSTCAGSEDVFSQREETWAGLGVIIAPLSETHPLQAVIHAEAQGFYEGVMNAGESSDIVDIDFRNPCWQEALKVRTTNTALLMGLLCGARHLVESADL